MAIGTAALINLGIQAVIAGGQYVTGRSKQKEADLAAQRAAAKLAGIKEPDEVSGLQVPTLGAELARQELGQQFATSVEAARTTGAAGVLGGIPSLAGLGADKALDIAAQLDALEKQRDQFVAQQLQARAQREATAQRQMVGMELMGAQQASAAARQQQQQAGIGFAQAAGETTAAYIKAKPLYDATVDATEKAAISAAKTSMEEATQAITPPQMPMQDTDLIQPPTLPAAKSMGVEPITEPKAPTYNELINMGMRSAGEDFEKMQKELYPSTQGLPFLFQPPTGLGG